MNTDYLKLWLNMSLLDELILAFLCGFRQPTHMKLHMHMYDPPHPIRFIWTLFLACDMRLLACEYLTFL